MIDINNIQQLVFIPFETSNKAKKYIVSSNGKHFEISASVVELIDVLKKTKSIRDTALQLSSLKNTTYSEEDIKTLISKYIEPLMVSENIKPPKTFLIEFELISAKTISILSKIFKLLFIPKIAIVISIFAVISEAFFFSYQGYSAQSSIIGISIYEIMGIILLYILSSLFHELGHASACAYFNTKHGGVGFGLYLNFPVFYTDVSNIWTLSRKQRIIVNLAGIYFQLIYIIPLIILSLLIQSQLISHFIFVINLNFLIILNPFFRFDGYWVTCDLLGVPNLRKRTTEYFLYLFKKLRCMKNLNTPFLLTMKPTEKVFMLIYTVIVNLFFGYYFCYMLPRFLYSFCLTFPSLAYQIIVKLSSGEMPDFQILSAVCIQLFFFCFTIYFLTRMIIPIIRKVSKYIKLQKVSSN
jgi:putative peptide zinc metalloprotease protein